MSGHPVAVWAGHRLRPHSRYRHPGDVIRLISGVFLLACSLVASAAVFRWLLGPAAPVAGGLGSGPASRVLTGSYRWRAWPRQCWRWPPRSATAGSACWAGWRWPVWQQLG